MVDLHQRCAVITGEIGAVGVVLFVATRYPAVILYPILNVNLQLVVHLANQLAIQVQIPVQIFITVLII